MLEIKTKQYNIQITNKYHLNNIVMADGRKVVTTAEWVVTIPFSIWLHAGNTAKRTRNRTIPPWTPVPYTIP